MRASTIRCGARCVPPGGPDHLYGAITDSGLRLGVALIIGHEAREGFDLPLASVVPDDIDGWLGANTAFVFWPGPSGKAVPKSDGVFAGIARSWAARNQCFGPTTLQ